jgi:hypothetical protein
MDELDRFRDFRRDVGAPSADAERNAAARLKRAITDEGSWRRKALRPMRTRRREITLAFAALAGVTAAALFVSAPWKTSTGFLERAEAALVPPAGTVLHTKSVWTRSVPGRCTVTDASIEQWVDQTAPHNYRVLGNEVDRDPCVRSGPGVELGGIVGSPGSLRFVPPNSLERTDMFQSGSGPDPVALFRQAIRAGTAHYEGKAEIDGRTVERVRLDAPPGACPPGFPRCADDPTYLYVDPETLYPVRLESPHGYGLPELGGPLVRFDNVLRWQTFEYLPGTADNRALADIRAQHPNATGP